MGGGSMHIEVPTIQCRTTSPALPSLNPSLPSSALNFPLSVNNNLPIRRSCTTETGQSSAPEKENKFCIDIFGSAPSQSEVETAISALHNFLRRIWSSESEFKRTLGGYGRVEEAFRLLLTEPIIQRVVFSLSSDKAVWDAVMNNEMVRELRESYVPKAQNHRIQGFNGEADVITYLLNWIMHITKAKVNQLIQRFELLLNQIFRQYEGEGEIRDEESKNEIDDTIRSSFTLSLVILLIVVMARFHKA